MACVNEVDMEYTHWRHIQLCDALGGESNHLPRCFAGLAFNPHRNVVNKHEKVDKGKLLSDEVEGAGEQKAEHVGGEATTCQDDSFRIDFFSRHSSVH